MPLNQSILWLFWCLFKLIFKTCPLQRYKGRRMWRSKHTCRKGFFGHNCFLKGYGNIQLQSSFFLYYILNKQLFSQYCEIYFFVSLHNKNNNDKNKQQQKRNNKKKPEILTPSWITVLTSYRFWWLFYNSPAACSKSAISTNYIIRGFSLIHSFCAPSLIDLIFRQGISI